MLLIWKASSSLEVMVTVSLYVGAEALDTTSYSWTENLFGSSSFKSQQLKVYSQNKNYVSAIFVLFLFGLSYLLKPKLYNIHLEFLEFFCSINLNRF